jgi:translation initiation factor IF-1
MVKNTKGGKGAKSLARKGQDIGESNFLRLPTCAAEQYACVTKMYGNGMCEIITDENVRLIGHIRSKFRGRQKRHNIVSQFSIVMIGLHEWESIPKNCDILCIYDDIQIDQLRTIPNVNIRHVLQLRQQHTISIGGNADQDDELVFTADANERDDAIADLMNQKGAESAFKIDETEQVNIDDI